MAKKNNNNLGNPLLLASAGGSLWKNTPTWGKVAIIGGVGFGVYWLVKTFIYAPVDFALETVGVNDTDGEKEVKAFTQSVDYQRAFDSDYYKSLPLHDNLSDSQAAEYAEMVYEANDLFDDDEDDVYGVFGQLNSKAQVSKLADVFYQKYTKHLYIFLDSWMDTDSELLKVTNMVKAMKNY